jgi:ATP-dependent DNA helicase DinG
VEELSSVLEPDGALSEYMAGYEPRWEQIDLLQMVAASFNSGSPVLAEAGTGVGKSFAYLIPAIRWAADNDERIVISTATIALQQQLMEKDIPFVIDLLGTAVKVALVKGRGNYLCLKKLEEAADDDELFSTGDGLEGLKVWPGKPRRVPGRTSRSGRLSRIGGVSGVRRIAVRALSAPILINAF